MSGYIEQRWGRAEAGSLKVNKKKRLKFNVADAGAVSGSSDSKLIGWEMLAVADESLKSHKIFWERMGRFGEEVFCRYSDLIDFWGIVAEGFKRVFVI